MQKLPFAQKAIIEMEVFEKGIEEKIAFKRNESASEEERKAHWEAFLWWDALHFKMCGRHLPGLEDASESENVSRRHKQLTLSLEEVEKVSQLLMEKVLKLKRLVEETSSKGKLKDVEKSLHETETAFYLLTGESVDSAMEKQA